MKPISSYAELSRYSNFCKQHKLWKEYDWAMAELKKLKVKQK